MKEKNILSIDCGTQSLRAMIFSAKGELMAKTQRHYDTCISPHPGWAEQEPMLYWESLCSATLELKAKNPDFFKKVAGVGVTTQRNSVINIDAHGDPLRPAILWLDQRKASPTFGKNTLLNAVINAMLKGTDMDKKVADIKSQGKCNWIMENQPDIWEKTHKYLLISGFLNHRLTGNYIDSTASQIGHLPFNYKTLKWSGKYGLSRAFFPIENSKLPSLVKPGETVGKITEKASIETGLPKGLPVVACGSDKGCETVGAGVLDCKSVSLSFGTTATIQTTSKLYFEPLPFMPPYPASIPDRYNPEIEIFRGYWMITWFKNEFAHKEVVEAIKRDVPAEEILNSHLQNTSPGSMGLVVQPYWGPGLDQPFAKGAMIGFGDIHKKAHVYRAVIEGLAYGLREGLEKIEHKGKFRARFAVVSGGASQSDEICRITADIFNLPMARGKTHETSGLGAAIITAKGLGLYSTFEEAVAQMVSIEEKYYPRPENVQLYDQLYNKVYKKMYRQLQPLYLEIQKITGYPE
ncbi:FGGY-family carbohydrate kinase [Desulfamplus magnetovallimortis]|uniref:FGGY-family carbohydrate kinase n=1 Tax=Desulfamplus magnetovallimortis TaxID=1246637 RepID=UPI001FEA9166|nr:FGGY-family carbohydrate kinase [Desulfamplus magnetovallimortis]